MTEIVEVNKRKFKSAMPKIIEGIANDLRNELVKTCPVDTGRLKGSLIVEQIQGGYGISMVEYGLFIEFGTPPHIIRPKDKQALSFTVNGREVIVKQVNHPGTRPNPFIRTAINTKLKEIIINNFRRHLK